VLAEDFACCRAKILSQIPVLYCIEYNRRIHSNKQICYGTAIGTAIGAIGATHHLFIATNSALQKFRILRTMGGINCVLMGFVCETKMSRSLRLASF